MRERGQPWSITIISALGPVAAAPQAVAALIPPQLVPEACSLSASGASLGGCTLCHLGALAINLTNFLMFAIAIPAAGLLAVIGGFIWMTAGGVPAQVERGRKILTATVVGALIVFLAWLGVDTFFKVFTAGERGFYGAIEIFGPWNQFPVEKCPL